MTVDWDGLDRAYYTSFRRTKDEMASRLKDQLEAVRQEMNSWPAWRKMEIEAAVVKTPLRRQSEGNQKMSRDERGKVYEISRDGSRHYYDWGYDPRWSAPVKRPKDWEAVWETAKALDVEISGMSWNGFNVAGDAKSIAEVRRLMHLEERLRWFEDEYAKLTKMVTDPVPMILHCPIVSCNARHIDEGEFATKVHHTHVCQTCGHVWRPAIVATVGVKFLPGFKNEAEK